MSEKSSLQSPYKGLMPYSEQDAPFFFGREPEQEIITANLMAARLTLLYGASGVGKSSVLRAGVAHHLRELARENLSARGTPESLVVVFRSWRDDPVAGLRAQIDSTLAEMVGAAPLLGKSKIPREGEGEGEGEVSLADYLASLTQQIDSDLLIILDQFEEYFLYHAQEDGEGTFAVEFPRAVNRLDLRASFLIAIREDALAKLDRFKGRIPNLFDNYLRIEHLDRQSARAAIIKPIAEYNRLNGAHEPVSIEPALVEAVLDQVKIGQVVLGETGRGVVQDGGEERDTARAEIETPYLQLVMTRLWDEESKIAPPPLFVNEGKGKVILRLETLNRLGGAERIVRTHLDSVMSALPTNEQDIAARIFHFLVTPSGTKIAHTVPDLADYANIPQAELASTLEKLSSSEVRILRPVAPPPDQPGAPRYEIFHDVLAAPVLDWRTRYVQAQERTLAEQHLAQERAESAKQLAQARQRVTRLRFGLIGLSLLLLAVIALAFFALEQRNTAERAQAETAAQRDAAEKAKADADAQRVAAETARVVAEQARTEASSRELAASALSQLSVDPALSVALAVQALKDAHTAQAEEALREALNQSTLGAVLSGHTDFVTYAAFSPDGRLAVTVSDDRTARVWLLASNSVGNAAAAQTAAVLRGHADYVTRAAFSADSKFLVTTSADGTARVWEIATGQTISVLRGHTDIVNDAAFSPDGKRIVTASSDHTARLWDAASGSLLATLSGHSEAVNTVAFSPDGKFVVTASNDDTARVWEVESGKSVVELRGHGDDVTSASFSPDGKSIVTASVDKTARLWDAGSGNSIRELRGHSGIVKRVQFSSDGKRVLTASSDDTARVWNVQTGETIAVLRGHTGELTDAEFSPDGKFAVTASVDKTARVWDINSVSMIAELDGHTDVVRTAAFSPDGQSLLTASLDNTARLWHINIGRELQGHGDTVNAVAISPDGTLAVTTSDDQTARLWDVKTAGLIAELRGHTGKVTDVAFSPDGKLIATGSNDDTVRLWDTTGNAVAELKGTIGSVTSVAFSPDGKFIAASRAFCDSCLATGNIWQVATGKIVNSMGGQSAQVQRVVYSPDGKYIASASLDKTTRFFEAATGKGLTLLRGHTDAVVDAAFSPDGQWLLTASRDNTARVWNVAATLNAGTVATTTVAVLSGHTAGLRRAAFSPDGKLVVTASDDRTARLWDARTWQSIAILRGHGDAVTDSVFSADGKFLVTTGADGSARLWDVATAREIAELRGHSARINRVAFSADGKFIITASDDKTARLFRCEVCAPLEQLLAQVQPPLTRDLTCPERQTFLHEQIDCAAITQVTTPGANATTGGPPLGTYTVSFSTDRDGQHFLDASGTALSYWPYLGCRAPCVYELRLLDAGAFTLHPLVTSNVSEGTVSGHFSVNGDEITLTEEQWPTFPVGSAGETIPCGQRGLPTTGTYKWQFSGRALTFIALRDSCPDRAFLLTNKPWTRTETAPPETNAGPPLGTYRLTILATGGNQGRRTQVNPGPYELRLLDEGRYQFSFIGELTNFANAIGVQGRYSVNGDEIQFTEQTELPARQFSCSSPDARSAMFKWKYAGRELTLALVKTDCGLLAAAYLGHQDILDDNVSGSLYVRPWQRVEGATTETNAGPPLGVYTSVITPEDQIGGQLVINDAYHLILLEGNRYIQNRNNDVPTDVTGGSYAVNGDKITLNEDAGPNACSELQGRSAIYKWEFGARQLTLTKIQDGCTFRVFVLTKHPLTRTDTPSPILTPTATATPAP